MDFNNLSSFLTPAILVPVLAGLATVAFVVAIGFIANRRTTSAESRLELFTRKGKGSGTGSNQSIEIWKDAAMQGDRNTFIDSLMPNLPSLEKLFQQADVTIRPSAVAMLSVVLGVLGMVVAWVFTANVILSILPGIGLFSIPWMWVLQQRKKRLKTFQQQMPDAMELLARALRAGQSLQAGLHIISEEMPPPVATEFGRVYEEQNLGVSMEDALKSLCDRVPNLDLRFFVTSVLIQRQTGGDLAEILDKIGYVIRERFKIQGRCRPSRAKAGSAAWCSSRCRSSCSWSCVT